MDIPQRYSLATQAAASIRQSIQSGIWTDVLPSERGLCLLLQISRPTLRTAIEILSHEGLVKTRSRQKARILKPAATKPPAERAMVVLLTGRRLHQHAASALSFIGKLQQSLSTGNFQFAIVDDPLLSKENPHRRLEKITAEYKAICYLLISVSEPVQMFFYQARLPAIICGSLYPRVRLPSCDWNYPAMGRHAAGVFLGKGHRHLCLLRPSILRSGDIEGEDGFKTVASHYEDSLLTVIPNNGRASSLYRTIQKTFSGKNRPTALFVLDPYDCITAIFALESLDLPVPEAVSVIGIDWANIFRALPFRVASYSDNSRFVEKSAKLVLKLVHNHVVPPRENLVMADFQAGDTIARPNL